MRLLITGGAGFIGSNFIKYVAKQYPDYHIINLDALTYAGNLESLHDVEKKPNYTFIKGNITDRTLVKSMFQSGIDAVINFAAESHVDRSIVVPDVFISTNVLGTQVLLEAASTHGVKKFLQISTDEVYGTLGPHGLFHETTPLAPKSPYSASKASADLLVRAYHETFGLPVNITRCSNNYGPFQFPEKLIPLMIIRALQNKSLPVYGDGLNIRDWLHVEDHCRAIDVVLHQENDGEIYNIGGNNEKTNVDIVKEILRYLGKSEKLIQFIADRPGHDRRYAIDASKIKKRLRWEPQKTFEDGIKETIDWYLANKSWWSSILNGEYEQFYQRQYVDGSGDVS